MPWVHLHIDTKGLVKACCNANIIFGNINHQSIEEIWQGEPIRKFRQQQLKGQWDKRCGSCLHKELAGKSSMRLETANKFRDKWPWVEQTHADGHAPVSRPVYLDVRFSNVCNLRCRTCWHGASSSWYDEAKILRNNAAKQAIVRATDNSQSLIDQLLEQPFAIEEIYFAGGEPLMMGEHYDLLRALIKTGNTSLHLRYNTNLSRLQTKDGSVMDLWKHFENVIVSASIDAMGEQVEYLRKGLDWKRFVLNMRSIRKALPHVKLEIAPTVSIFNALSIGDLHQYFINENLIEPDAIYLNMLERPDYFNIKILSAPLKTQVEKHILGHIEWLRQKGTSQPTIDEFKAMISFMKIEDFQDRRNELLKQTLRLDKLRGEDFKKHFPALSSLLDPV